MATTWKALATLAIVPFMATACLLKERTDTWYLEPSGAVSWSVIEKDVRSDAQAAVDRQNEEAAYISAVRSQTHPLARAFGLLGPAPVRTQILRGTLPFTVITQATFASIDALGLRLIGRLRLSGSSVLERSAEGTQWTFSVRDPRAQDAAKADDEDLEELVNGLDGLHVVLTAGHFLAGENVQLSSDRRAATLTFDANAAKSDDGGLTVIKLRWSDR